MASLPMVAVTARIHDQEGNPVSGVRVTMRLTTVERYNGLVVPRETSGLTDASGVVVLNVWPNELGSEGSEYAVSISYGGNCASVCGASGMSKRFHAVVPNRDCNLLDIAELEPYEMRGAGQVIPSQVAFQASEAANCADRCQSILEAMQAQEAVFRSIGWNADSAKTAAMAHSAKAEEHENNAREALAQANRVVSLFENSVAARTEQTANSLIADATTTLTRTKAAALEQMESRVNALSGEITSLGSQTISGIRSAARESEQTALANIREAEKSALEALREEGALFGEDFEALAERAESAAKRAGCLAAAADNSATRACKCAERAEIAEANIRRMILDAAATIISEEIIELASEKAIIGALESAKAVWAPLVSQIVRLADRHTADVARLEREKVNQAMRQEKMNALVISLK